MSSTNGTRSSGALSHPLFEIRKSRIQGRGAFAKRRIRKGQKIVEYTGEKIDNDEADRRYDEDNMNRHHTFLFTLDDDWCIDGDVRSNIARLINHSCDPNCEAVITRGHIWLEAIRAIPAGTELVYDYQYEDDADYTEEDLRFYACKCGAPNCRGTIVKTRKRLKP